MRFKGPLLILSGPYSINGKILILPIQGNGLSNFTLYDPELHIRFTGKVKNKDGKVHLYTDDLRMTFKISKWVETEGFSSIQVLIIWTMIFFSLKSWFLLNEYDLYSNHFISFFYSRHRMQTNFANLFNGDRVLGETTNRFLNENWKDIFNEIKGSIFDAFSLITQSMLNSMWSHHDYKRLFLE